MSVEAFSWALNVPVGGNAKVVLLGLANHAHPDGREAYPSYSRLATYACCDRSTAKRQVRRLVADGWVLPDLDVTGVQRVGPTGELKWVLPVGKLAQDLEAERTPRDAERPAKAGAEHPRGEMPPVHDDPDGGCTAVHPEPSFNRPVREADASLTSRVDRPEVVELCDRLAERMLANDPAAKVAPASKGWRDAARLLLDRDRRSVDDVRLVIDWTQADAFEHKVVLSMPKLRERFPGLLLKARPAHTVQPPGRQVTPGDSGAKKPEAAPACPGCSSDHARVLWERGAARLRAVVPPALFDGYLAGLHAHGVTRSGHLELGCPRELVGWVQDRFPDALERATNEKVLVVPCAAGGERAAAA